tara:strand:+ start:2590 stop:2874 length:285 start_codon:yes stop_codon:yes gene_type:complete
MNKKTKMYIFLGFILIIIMFRFSLITYHPKPSINNNIMKPNNNFSEDDTINIMNNNKKSMSQQIKISNIIDPYLRKISKDRSNPKKQFYYNNCL